jgi:hypothetical protein
MTQTLQIGSYTWRSMGERDRWLLNLWIAEDADHAGKTDADFFLRYAIGVTECYAVEDELGLVVFYVKMTPEKQTGTLWLDMQFGPDGGIERRRWVSQALIAGFDWLKMAALGAGIQRISFESTKPTLRIFCERRLGFVSDGDILSYAVVAPDRSDRLEKALQQ